MMLKAIWNVIGHSLIILRQQDVNKREVGSAYFGLTSKRLFKKRHRKGVLRLFDYTFEYFDYVTVVSLFEEIFVSRDYFFIADTKSPLIIDCGSNIGMSVLFFRHTYPQSKIIAFEPDRTTFEVLAKNVEENQFSNVTLINKAVYSSDGTLEFYSDPAEAGSLMMSLSPQRLNAKSEKVDTVRLSKYIESSVDFLKLDVEGAESAVIDEMAESGKLRLVRQMVIEYHHHLNANEDVLSHLLSVLEENGFGYQIIAEWKTPFQPRKFQDILIYCYQRKLDN